MKSRESEWDWGAGEGAAPTAWLPLEGLHAAQSQGLGIPRMHCAFSPPLSGTYSSIYLERPCPLDSH